MLNLPFLISQVESGCINDVEGVCSVICIFPNFKQEELHGRGIIFTSLCTDEYNQRSNIYCKTLYNINTVLNFVVKALCRLLCFHLLKTVRLPPCSNVYCLKRASGKGDWLYLMHKSQRNGNAMTEFQIDLCKKNLKTTD